MVEKRPLGITLIGYFYIFGAVVIAITLFTNAKDQFGIAVRFGVPNFPENIMRVLVSMISLIMAYGYLKLEKWGYWLMLIYTIYFLTVSITLYQQYNQQPFYGNIIWSIIVLIYTLLKRKYFNKRDYVL
ncbi:hypothetical protein [Tepidibacter aestuarii]|uniref:hypothetical protein n=1 Tax=Tepidibacter aestuarii TaxID=2925782 RepID=UPI0020C15C1A|nr:hypothetical protein [Tepidibacter aestuarii]CAH2213894.1 conserved membrane protein of unknown function [Tepidibacter aestuarii]